MYRNDITLVPHCYDLRWARETNRLLGEHVNCPVKMKETGYLKGRLITHQYIGRLLEYIRKKDKGQNKMIFTNLMEDFSFDFVKTTEVKDFYGFFVCSNYIDMVGSDERIKLWESAVANVCKKVFVLTEFHAKAVPFRNVAVVGLPNTFKIQPPRLGKRIIYNHRLQSDKLMYEAFKLDEDVKRNLVFTVPKWSQNHLEKFKKVFPVYTKPNEAEYQKIMSQGSFGVTWCSHELFGVSIVECIASGMLMFVPATFAGYSDYTVKECQFTSPEDLSAKYRYYMKPENKEERIDVILRCQELIKKYQADTWIKTILNEIEK